MEFRQCGSSCYCRSVISPRHTGCTECWSRLLDCAVMPRPVRSGRTSGRTSVMGKVQVLPPRLLYTPRIGKKPGHVRFCSTCSVPAAGSNLSTFPLSTSFACLGIVLWSLPFEHVAATCESGGRGTGIPRVRSQLSKSNWASPGYPPTMPGLSLLPRW